MHEFKDKLQKLDLVFIHKKDCNVFLEKYDSTLWWCKLLHPLAFSKQKENLKDNLEDVGILTSMDNKITPLFSSTYNYIVMVFKTSSSEYHCCFDNHLYSIEYFLKIMRLKAFL